MREDFKWLSGISAFVFLAVAFLLFNAVYLTSKPVAVELGALATAAMFSPKGLDDATDIDIVRRRAKAGADIQPIPGLPVTLSAQDIASKSPRELRLTIFRQIVEPIYEGEEGISAFTGKDLTREEIMSEYGVLAFISRDTHRLLRNIFMAALLPAGAALVLLAYFSRGWGRLVSPALAVALSSLPWLLLFTLLWFVSGQTPPTEGPLAGRAGLVIREVGPVATGKLMRIYAGISGAAAAALIAAAMGTAVKKKKTARSGRT
jgi:hypothetical protein